MGWWSKKVMGGDRPLDILSWMAEACGCETSYDDPAQWHGYIWSAVDAESVRRMAKVIGRQRDDDRSIAAQVLAVVVMRCGAPLDGALRERLADLIARDEWARENDERDAEIQRLLRDLRDYDTSQDAREVEAAT